MDEETKKKIESAIKLAEDTLENFRINSAKEHVSARLIHLIEELKACLTAGK